MAAKKPKKPLFELMKVFHFHKIPQDIRQAVLDIEPDSHNGVYLKYTVKDAMYEEPDPKREMVDAWLIANGAEDGGEFEGECVLIGYWW